jgi:hypothetical protein
MYSLRFGCQQRTDIFRHLKNLLPFLDPSIILLMKTGALSLELKRPEREVDHLTLDRTSVKNYHDCASNLLFSFLELKFLFIVYSPFKPAVLTVS